MSANDFSTQGADFTETWLSPISHLGLPVLADDYPCRGPSQESARVSSHSFQIIPSVCGTFLVFTEKRMREGRTHVYCGLVGLEAGPGTGI